MIPKFVFALRSDLVGKAEFLPTKGDALSTGWDVRCAEPEGVLLAYGDRVMIPLGIRMLAPAGWWLELRPRSSAFVKKDLHALYGVIDETYENEICFACRYLPKDTTAPMFVEFGERIGQVVPVKRQEMFVESVSNEAIDELYSLRGGERKTGGFGSTGTN